MCLTIKTYKTNKAFRRAKPPLPEVATHDMLVFKRLTIRNKSPYQHQTYVFGKKYYSQLGIDSDSSWCRIIVNKGLHAYLTKELAKEFKTGYEAIRPAIIPKGAKYFIGEHRDIVATQLIVYRDMDNLRYLRKEEKPYLAF